MDILNFFDSWIKGGKYSTTAPIDAVTVVGVPNTNSGDLFLPVTVPISALQTNIGKLMGGGIVVSEWVENGVHKALVASLTNLGSSVWSLFPTTAVGTTGQSLFDGLTNTNAIIAQTGAPAATTYAAGIARLYLGGGYNDWYLPSKDELNKLRINRKVLGISDEVYWSSTELDNIISWNQNFLTGEQNYKLKYEMYSVRAVRSF